MQPEIELGIIAAKTEELDALLERFTDPIDPPPMTIGHRRPYLFRQTMTASGRTIRIALTRTNTQGNAEAKATATDLIHDCNPRLVILCGISGVRPNVDQASLGDVVLGHPIFDLSVSAATKDGSQMAPKQVPQPERVVNFLANLSGRKEELGDWNTAEAIGVPRFKAPSTRNHHWTGNDDYDKSIVSALKALKSRDEPRFHDAAIASSDVLVKDIELLADRHQAHRGLLANEMEAAGVGNACNDAGIPWVVVRANSDIVGFPRSADYTLYACHVAASFTHALVKMNVIEQVGRPDAVEVGQDLGELVELLTHFKFSLPLAVIARSLSLNEGDVRAAVQLHGLVNINNDRISAPEHAGTGEDAPLGFAISVLGELLSHIQSHSRSGLGAKEVPGALALYLALSLSQQKLIAPRFFDVLDDPMKARGDKRLVAAVGQACIDACQHPDRTPEEAECEARARTCAIAWVYQRQGEYDRAMHEIELSTRISTQLGLTKNLAFTKKCGGRLARLQAENTEDESLREKLYHRSLQLLAEAREHFAAHDEFGEDSSQVGECESLIARTYLSMDREQEGRPHIREARLRLDDEHAKAYLDLQILLGDYCQKVRNKEGALRYYSQVIKIQDDENYQVSEIRARALFQRGCLRQGFSQTEAAVADLSEAASIWAQFGEEDNAAVATWQVILCRHSFKRGVARVLKQHDPVTRVRAFEIVTNAPVRADVAHQRRNVADADIPTDHRIWERALNQAKTALALNQ